MNLKYYFTEGHDELHLSPILKHIMMIPYLREFILKILKNKNNKHGERQ